MVKAVELLTRDRGRPETYGEETPFEKLLKFSFNCRKNLFFNVGNRPAAPD